MRNHSIAPAELLGSVWRNRELIGVLTKRDVISRYRGSILGLLWSFFNPLFMLAVYTFVFGNVIKSRWAGTAGNSEGKYAVILFSGLIVFNIFSECANRAPTLILSNVNYVTKVVFPLEVLPIVAIGTALFHALISLCVWLVFYFFAYGWPPITALLFPVTILPFLIFTIGISWLLASLGVYLRDIGQFIGIIVTAMMFLSPLFFPISSLPANYQHLLQFNPMTSVIEQVRSVMIWGVIPDWKYYLSYFAIAVVVAYFGFAWFQKTRKGFADAI